MTPNILRKIDDAIWAASELFKRNKVSGSSANLSFIEDGNIYITGSGTCFGRLTAESFSCVRPNGEYSGIAPSKELELHRILYNKDGVNAVIHTHSYYSTLWSCLPHKNEIDVIPQYTPYLKMKLGRIGIVPFAPPGSQQLFDLFAGCVGLSDGFLLANHGPIIGGRDILSAFYIIEELEESARIAWDLRDLKNARLC